MVHGGAQQPPSEGVCRRADQPIHCRAQSSPPLLPGPSVGDGRIPEPASGFLLSTKWSQSRAPETSHRQVGPLRRHLAEQHTDRSRTGVESCLHPSSPVPSPSPTSRCPRLLIQALVTAQAMPVLTRALTAALGHSHLHLLTRSPFSVWRSALLGLPVRAPASLLPAGHGRLSPCGCARACTYIDPRIHTAYPWCENVLGSVRGKNV